MNEETKKKLIEDLKKYSILFLVVFFGAYAGTSFNSYIKHKTHRYITPPPPMIRNQDARQIPPMQSPDGIYRVPQQNRPQGEFQGDEPQARGNIGNRESQGDKEMRRAPRGDFEHAGPSEFQRKSHSRQSQSKSKK